MSERLKPKQAMVEVKVRRTKRATVTIPNITESNSEINLRKKNREIVESLKENNKAVFKF